MDPRLRALLERIRETSLDMSSVVFDDVNAVNTHGDNALHCVARWNDLDAARLLIDSGINVNQYGELGYTPLHSACIGGHHEMVRLLVEHGADLYALTEGNSPFSLARLGGHDDLCEMLRPLLLEAQKNDPRVWTRVRIAHLRRELRRLESLVKRGPPPY